MKISAFDLLILAAGAAFLYYKLHDVSNDNFVSSNADHAQISFIHFNQFGQRAYADRNNDAAVPGIWKERNNNICSMSLTSVANWIGVVDTIGRSGENATIRVRIADGIYVQTWNNSLSDMTDDTLIKPSGSLFASVLSLKEGDRVQFSGAFLPDPKSCIREVSLTDDGSLKEPEYVFRFSSLHAKE